MAKKTQAPRTGSQIAQDIIEKWRRYTEARTRLDEEIRNQSDRGAGIIAAAMVDDALMRFMKSKMEVVNTKIDGRRLDTQCLFSPEHALGSFGVRSRLAFAMRLIEADVFFDLDDIREIRNGFAHWPQVPDSSHVNQSVTFTTDAIRDRCQRLRYPDACPPHVSVRLYALFQQKKITGNEYLTMHDRDAYDPAPTESRERFIYTCEGLLRQLLAAATSAPIQIPLRYQRFAPETQDSKEVAG